MVILQDIPSAPLFLYHFMSFSTKLNFFAHETANIINALLCLITYSLFANTLHPVKRCCTIYLCWLDSLHYCIWQALLKLSMILFQPFVPAEAVFLGVVFCLSHELQISFCFPNISLCICPIPKFCPIQKQ